MTIDYPLGCQMPTEDWVRLNRMEVFNDPTLRRYVSPFPPRDLMQNVSGLVSESDFASHGTDFFLALSAVSPKPLSAYRSILDFGCGCGRLARMFKGHPARVCGCDIDHRHVNWVRDNLKFVEAKLSSVNPPIPYADNEFEAVISISIFTHLTEYSQDLFLAELARVTQPGGYLFLTVHGERALHRALTEPAIRNMLSMDEDRFQRALQAFKQGKHGFVLQEGHLTTSGSDKRSLTNLFTKKVVEEPFEYGITFVPEHYVQSHWSKWFKVEAYHSGALHDFQDIVVLRPRM